MKKILLLSFILSFYLAIPVQLCAQDEAVDVITLLDGKIMKGKITGIQDDAFTFVYQGEALTYTVKKSDINQIEFASGRVEVINEISVASGSNDAEEMPIQPNLVAVLPFSYMGQGGARDVKLGKKVQSDCYNLLLKFAPHYTIQDPMKTNAYLARHGVDEGNFDSFLPDEFCHMLGAEYVVIGSVLVNFEGTTNYSSTSSESKKKDDGNKKTTYSNSSTSSTDKFETQVDIKVYNQDGQNISSQSRTSFWPTEDAYQATMQYLLKRGPLYSK